MLNLNVKPPLHKRQAPLLTAFWQLFWSANWEWEQPKSDQMCT